ncbi:MAG TPA: ABC transporter permease [Microscillaceae bacterium]|nr:ABC transporter permease [Microscillaceae bacterium]
MFKLYFWIASRLARHKKGNFSKLITQIAVASIAISLTVIIAAYAVLIGFQQAIQAKVFSLSGHLQVYPLNNQEAYEQSPLSTRAPLYQRADQLPAVQAIYLFGFKPGIIKFNDEVLGVILKGVDKKYTQHSFQQNIIEGRFIEFSDTTYSREVVVSKLTANKLRLKLRDTLMMYFVQDPPRARALVVSGIYQTGMEGIDDKLMVGDLALIQRLNLWADTLVDGYEVFAKDFTQLHEAQAQVKQAMEHDMDVVSVVEKHHDIFDWLLLLNNNVYIFLTLILLVACFNMTAILLIMIMEQVQTIGLLKAMGAADWQIRRIFILQGLRLLGRGMLWGNSLGIGLCAVQYFFKLIPLDVENYYLSYVPIAWSLQTILGVNALMFFLVSLVLILPTLLILRIKPIQAIRFS